MSQGKKGKILTAARSVFLRYGFRRANMNDIAEAAGVSRPALYVLFKSKEEIFCGVYTQWLDGTIAEVEREVASPGTPPDRLERAFEIWSVRPFEMTMTSPEAKELLDCNYEFVQASLRHGYRRFETALVPVLTSLASTRPVDSPMAPETIAHVLSSAVRGFKQTATTPDELRQLVKDLLKLSFGAVIHDATRT